MPGIQRTLRLDRRCWQLLKDLLLMMEEQSLLKRLRTSASTLITQRFGSSSKARERKLVGTGSLSATGDEAKPPSAGGAGDFLLANAVTPGVKDHYKRAVLTFLLFCSSLQLPLCSVAEIDRAMCAYFDESYFDGGGPTLAELTICGFCDLAGSHRPGDFPLAWRSARAWRRLKPPHARHSCRGSFVQPSLPTLRSQMLAWRSAFCSSSMPISGHMSF